MPNEVGSGIIVYGTKWCSHSKRTRRFLDEQQINYEWIDIDQDSEAEAYVKQINHGYRSVPTIVFPDGTTLTEPSNAELTSKLGLRL
jgi:glutaredoxin-like protein